MNGAAELLVILDDGTGDALEHLRSVHRVSHVGSPRVAVVERPAAVPEASLGAIPGVAVLAGAGVPADVLESLSAEEKLFVSAWLRRMAEGTRKERAGDGLPWDAPGFTPPDPPASRSR